MIDLHLAGILALLTLLLFVYVPLVKGRYVADNKSRPKDNSALRVVPGVAPRAGETLTKERLAESLMFLNPQMSKERAYQVLSEIDEMKRQQKGTHMNHEPVLTSTSIGLIIGAVLALLVSFGVDLSNEQVEAILELVALLAPIAVSVFVARSKVTPTE